MLLLRLFVADSLYCGQDLGRCFVSTGTSSLAAVERNFHDNVVLQVFRSYFGRNQRSVLRMYWQRRVQFRDSFADDSWKFVL